MSVALIACVRRAAAPSVCTRHSGFFSCMHVAFSTLCASSARAAWTFPSSNLARYQSYSCSRAVHSPHARISPPGPSWPCSSSAFFMSSSLAVHSSPSFSSRTISFNCKLVLPGSLARYHLLSVACCSSSQREAS